MHIKHKLDHFNYDLYNNLKYKTFEQGINKLCFIVDLLDAIFEINFSLIFKSHSNCVI